MLPFFSESRVKSMSKQREKTKNLNLVLAFLIATLLTSCANVRQISGIETSADADECAAAILDGDPETIPDDSDGCRVVARVYDVCSY